MIRIVGAICPEKSYMNSFFLVDLSVGATLSQAEKEHGTLKRV